MFVAEAHSFQQQARLAITLAWVAGYTNLQTILICGTVTSHVSGTATNLGRSVIEGVWVAQSPDQARIAWTLAIHAFLLIWFFFVGTCLSAVCVELGRRREWESIYVLPMAIEAGALGVFALLVELYNAELKTSQTLLFSSTCLAAAAMGLQNATITRISSGVVRTTHVTGVLTDLGLETTQFLWWLWDRRHHRAAWNAKQAIHFLKSYPTARRLALLASILGSFGFGAALGTAFHDYAPRWTMFPPVAFLIWIIYQDLARPIADVEPSSLVGAESELGLPASLSIYHVRKDARRHGKIHQMPNLIAWSDRLPVTAKVVILDLGVASWIDRHAFVEMRAASLRMRAQGKRLIVAGLDAQQCEQLRAAWGGDLKPEDVWPELDLAIAHALVVLEETVVWEDEEDDADSLQEAASAGMASKGVRKREKARAKKKRSKARAKA
jgi:uncharacterized membrane protein YoaK (UPF0700 family)